MDFFLVSFYFTWKAAAKDNPLLGHSIKKKRIAFYSFVYIYNTKYTTKTILRVMRVRTRGIHSKRKRKQDSIKNGHHVERGTVRERVKKVSSKLCK
jgi:hypothetical protein